MRCIKALLAFFTAVPLKAPELDFTCAWALPYVAAPVVGGAGAAAYAATHDPLVSYLVLLLATGLNHLDGLADSADALMVRDRKRRGPSSTTRGRGRRVFSLWLWSSPWPRRQAHTARPTTSPLTSTPRP
jgi:cobalamin-5''-phosphate synthase (EC 2.7.8.26)